MENNHGLAVTPPSCHAESFRDLAEHPLTLKPAASMTIPLRRLWQASARNLSPAAEVCREGRQAPGRVKPYHHPSSGPSWCLTATRSPPAHMGLAGCPALGTGCTGGRGEVPCRDCLPACPCRWEHIFACHVLMTITFIPAG